MPAGSRFTGKITQESKHILGCLLQDFRTRGLGADALESGYVGMAIGELRKRSLGADHTTTAVDFDLALKELGEKELIDTGPMEAIDNPPGSVVIFVGLYNKREYVHLTEKGYRAAR
jgi:hypothetical protein